MATPDITGAEQRINDTLAGMVVEVKSLRASGEKSNAEIDARIAKMGADLAKMDAALASLQAAHVAAPVLSGGDVRRRYVSNGVVRAFGGAEIIRVGTKDTKVFRDGFFTSQVTVNEDHVVAKAAFELAVLRAAHAGLIRFSYDENGAPVINRAQFLRTISETSPELVVRMSIAAHAAGLTDSPEFVIERVFGVGTGNGGDFIPAEVLLPDMTRIGGAAMTGSLVSQFQQRTVTARNPYIMVTSGLPRPYNKGSATAAAAAALILSGSTTAKRAIEPKGLAVGVRIDRDFEDDALVSAMIELRQDLARGAALGIEDAIINGDASTPHQDTALASWNPEGVFTAGGSEVGGTLDHRRMWRGLRRAAFDLGNTINVGGDPTFATVQAMHKSFTGARGNPERTIIVTDFATAVGKLSTITEVTTIEKYGPGASIATGEIGRIGGKRIIRSPFMGRSGSNTGSFTAAGLYTTGGTFNKAAMLMVDAEAWTVATRKGMTVESAAEIGTDSNLVIATQRVAFMSVDHPASISSSDIKNVCLAYGINV